MLKLENQLRGGNVGPTRAVEQENGRAPARHHTEGAAHHRYMIDTLPIIVDTLSDFPRYRDIGNTCIFPPRGFGPSFFSIIVNS